MFCLDTNNGSPRQHFIESEYNILFNPKFYYICVTRELLIPVKKWICSHVNRISSTNTINNIGRHHSTTTGNTNREIKATGHFKTVEKYPHQSNKVYVTDVDQKKKTQQKKKKKTEQIKKLQKKKELTLDYK